MTTESNPLRFWTNWLSVVTAGVVAFGLILVLAPSFSRQAFSLLVYFSTERVEGFGQEATRYVSLTHAVLGGVMAGWGAALFYVTRALLSRGSRVAWNLIATSIAVWFVPDTTYSLLSGYWPNAVLNLAFLVLFSVPLWAVRGSLDDDP